MAISKNRFVRRINPLFLKGVCHRGLHNHQFTENGLLAFKNARDHHMAFELDVHLTRDNQLIVCHDENLKRTTGKDGIIEDMDVRTIKENYRLLDGEEVPTLQEVLEANKEEVPIIIEMKVFRKNYEPLSRRLLEELKVIRDKKNIILISFDPRSLTRCRHSGFVRQLLVSDDKQYRWIFHLKRLFEGIDIDQARVRERQVRRYGKHHMVNYWTIETIGELDKILPYGNMVTFQHADPDEVRNRMTVKNMAFLD